MFLFTDKNRFRKLVVWIAESRAFEAVILLAILVNSVFLGMSDFRYADSTNTLQPGSWRNTMILNAEAVFTAIFATEAVMKIIGMGFVVSKGSYLRDPWNMLDFTVVLAAYVLCLTAVRILLGLIACAVTLPQGIVHHPRCSQHFRSTKLSHTATSTIIDDVARYGYAPVLLSRVV